MGGSISYFKSTSGINKMDSVDLNGDGVITRSEFDQWLKTTYNQQTLEYQALLANRDVTINDLRKQINILSEANEQLRSVNNKSNKTRRVETLQTSSGISKEKINEFVDELLKDENINIKYLPDYVEKQLYRNIFTIAVGVLDKILNTTELNMIGHQIKLSIEPQHKLNEKNKTNVIDSDTIDSAIDNYIENYENVNEDNNEINEDNNEINEENNTEPDIINEPIDNTSFHDKISGLLSKKSKKHRKEKKSRM